MNRFVDKKSYELKDHLGNVRAVVSDQKASSVSVAANGSGPDSTLILSLSAKLLSSNNYYPFGMEEPGSGVNAQNYRYGYNGKEKDQKEEWGLTNYDYGARIYNPALGKFLSPDPMERMLSGWSPYTYAKSNPILYIDQDGQYPFTFFVRSYESSGYFGFPFTSLGDNRIANTSSLSSARIHYKMDIETNGNKLKKYDAWSSPSIQLHYPIAPNVDIQIDKAIPKKSGSADGNGNYGFQASASEPIMSKLPGVGGLTPDIDIKGTMNIVEKGGTLNIKGQIKGDGFPDAESFIQDRAGQSLMLGTYDHGPMGNPALSLPGEGNQQMIDINVKVKLDKNGNFSKAWSLDSKGNKSRLNIVAPEKKN